MAGKEKQGALEEGVTDMKKKTVWVIACIAALAVAFAGCGKSNFGVVVNENLNIEITAENAKEVKRLVGKIMEQLVAAKR